MENTGNHRDDDGDAKRCPSSLKFVEEYVSAIDSVDRDDVVWERFYADMAVDHDTKGEACIGGRNIWAVRCCLSLSLSLSPCLFGIFITTTTFLLSNLKLITLFF